MADPSQGGMDVLSALGPLARGQFIANNWDKLKGLAQGQVDQQVQQQEAQKIALAQAISHAQQAEEAQSAWLADPSADNLTRYSVFNPEGFKTIKAAHDMKREDQQRGDLRHLSTLNGLMSAGDWEGAAAAQQQRVDADAKAGLDTTEDQHALDLMKEKNPAALALTRAALYATLGPDKYTAAYESDAKNALATAQAAKTNAEAKAAGYLKLSKDEAAIPLPGSPGLGGETPAPTAGTAPRAPGAVGQAIDKVVSSVGAAPGEADYLHTTAMIESRGNPNAKNGSSTGPFQFHPDTFARMGGTDINDPTQQAAAALTLARQDAGALRNALKREPTPGEVYLAHQQGIAGAQALLTAPEGTKAVDAIAPFYKDRKTALKAITGNGGKPNMTAAEFAQHWTDKYAEFAGSGGGSAAPSAGDNGLPPGSVLNRGAPDAAEAEMPLSPEAVAMIGTQYLSQGPSALQNLGQGKVGVGNKNKILSWAAQQAKEAGTTNPELVARFVQNKGNQQALNQVTKNLSLITASESTLAKNLDLAKKYAPKGVGPTGVPWLDTPINKIRVENGSVDAKVYQNLLVTTADEYAKVLTTTSGSGGGATSDAARNEAHGLFNPGMTLRQFIDSAEAAKAEAANRHAANSNEKARLIAEMAGGLPGGKPAAAAAPAPPPPPGDAPRRIKFDAKGNVIK